MSFLVIGEALVDIVIQPGGDRREHPGGSPLNVAVGLARLQNPTELIARMGHDEPGELLRRHLDGSGVALDPACIDDLPTATAAAQLDAGGHATYHFDLQWILPEVPARQGIQCVHIGSIGAFLEPGATGTVALAASLRDSATVSFDPNIRTEFTGEPQTARKHVESIVAMSDVVKVSDQDLAWLIPGADPATVAADWLSLGPALVVVTRGGSDALAVAQSGPITVPAEPVEVVDTVGAGDAFTTGLLDALGRAGLLGQRDLLRGIDGHALRGALEFAGHVAAITCSRAGANPPWKSEL
ncbi:MAG TPA: carbohydrate kinase [Mycobacteriales bacterium]|nr:carbohydrate kinase [Mycobacteriales bacterium]